MMRQEIMTAEQIDALLRKTYGKNAGVAKQVIEVMKELKPVREGQTKRCGSNPHPRTLKPEFRPPGQAIRKATAP